MLAENGAILHSSLLQLHIQVVAIATQHGLDAGQGEREPAKGVGWDMVKEQRSKEIHIYTWTS